MASFATACRISSRIAGRALRQDVAIRGFRTSSAALAAQNFTMPALSPTMTEGNIATWRVKEGDKFVAGDVLLEIETDKATMDVEAQEDGVLMKIMQGDGSKGVQVGTRIAVIAEEGDDVSTLEIPPDGNQNQPQAAAPVEAPKEPEQPSPAELQQQQQPQSSQTAPSKKRHSKQTYPLYPSVAHLLKINGLDASAAASITPTGPNGRLLKGDVLAYLGQIDAQTPSAIESRFEHASHLDLSNIKVAAAAAAPPKSTSSPTTPQPAPLKSRVSVPISLSAVIEVQNKVHATLGVFLPLSTFIARATELANEQLPLPKGYQPTADELFNQVLGLDKVVDSASRGSRGAYLPQVAALAPPPAPQQQQQSASRSVAKKSSGGGDIIDLLAAAAPTRRPTAVGGGDRKQAVLSGPSASGPNLFSLQVPEAEERRARVFLERVKLVLERDPGRLVL